MKFYRRRTYKNQLGKLQLIAFAVFIALSSAIAFYVWQNGSDTVLGIPLQISLISLVLPILCGGLIFWFARKYDELSWQRDDER